MKKLNLLMGLFVILALVLSACNANNNMNATETMEADEPVLGLTDDEVFGDVPDDGDDMEMEETAVITETESTMTDTPEPEATQDLSGAEVIPQMDTNDTGRLANLMDYNVVTMDNEEVGEIDDFIINLDEQKIEYALVEVGGFLGIGEKEVAVPYTQLTLATVDDDGIFEDGREAVFTYAGDAALLENAPEFDEDVLPRLYDENTIIDDWDLDFRSIWTDDANDDMDDIDNITEMRVNENLRGVTLASELMDLQVLDDVDTTYNDDYDDDEVLGTLTEIIVDPQTGKLRYLVIELDFMMDGTSARYAPVPLYAPYAPYAYYNDEVSLVISANMLGNAPFFEEDSFPVTTAAGWDYEYDTYWNDLQ